MNKIVTIIGARPQFIKSAPVSKALLNSGLREIVIHTGQHYDIDMSDVFFQELSIPQPHYHLDVGSGSHGKQTGRMLEKIEAVLLDENPELVIVYGDTNSTLAGALAAAKLHIPIAHIEAGLRSFNRNMPEEINRVLTDHMATYLFAPTAASVANLRNEGIIRNVFNTGDVMYDLVLELKDVFQRESSKYLKKYLLESEQYSVLTLHRAENTDSDKPWKGILEGIIRIAELGHKILWPVHPRIWEKAKAISHGNILKIDPLPYIEFHALLENAKLVITDSGGLQKEAAFHHKPCITIREETEWVELVDSGFNHLAGSQSDKIVELFQRIRWPEANRQLESLYGDGKTSQFIAHTLLNL